MQKYSKQSLTKKFEKLALEEKRKISKLVKENIPFNQILEQVDQRFLSIEKAQGFAKKHETAKYNNSGETRTFNIMGGIGCIILTGILLAVSGRLFYILPIIGLILIVKGFSTEDVKIND